MDYSSNGGAWWEWLGEGTRQKRLVTLDQLPISPGSYSDPVRQDLLPPTKSHRFRGHGLSWDELQDLLEAVDERGATVTITDKNGKVWTGYLTSVTYSDLEGLTLYDVEIQLEV